MAPKVKTEAVYQLLTRFADKLNVELDNEGFIEISEAIDDEINEKYLRDLYRRVRLAREVGKDEIRAHPNKLTMITRAFCNTDFRTFETEVLRPLDRALANCFGNWWSYVRANKGPAIFKAPVRIYNDKERGPHIILKGEQNTFTGRIELLGGCLFCELVSGPKKLYIVMKSSTNEQFSVLQGTFVGISSASQPIAGREVWVREEKKGFEDMNWERLNPDEENSMDYRIRLYFSDAEKNCIKIDKVSSYTLDDLIIE